MIMSVHDPLSRKRSLSNPNLQEGPIKKLKSNEEATVDRKNTNMFSEKMYHTYVKSALESLDKVCPFFLV